MRALRTLALFQLCFLFAARAMRPRDPAVDRLEEQLESMDIDEYAEGMVPEQDLVSAAQSKDIQRLLDVLPRLSSVMEIPIAFRLDILHQLLLDDSSRTRLKLNGLTMLLADLDESTLRRIWARADNELQLRGQPYLPFPGDENALNPYLKAVQERVPGIWWTIAQTSRFLSSADNQQQDFLLSFRVPVVEAASREEPEAMLVLKEMVRLPGFQEFLENSLQLALFHRNQDVLLLLKTVGADLNADNGRILYGQLAFNAPDSFLYFLLQQDVQPYYQNPQDGTNTLVLAIRMSRFAFAKTLLEEYGKFEKRHLEQALLDVLATALYQPTLSLGTGNAFMLADLLIRRGAGKEEALRQAFDRRNWTVFTYLLTRGVNLGDRKNQALLQDAARLGLVEPVQNAIRDAGLNFRWEPPPNPITPPRPAPQRRRSSVDEAEQDEREEQRKAEKTATMALRFLQSHGVSTRPMQFAVLTEALTQENGQQMVETGTSSMLTSEEEQDFEVNPEAPVDPVWQEQVQRANALQYYMKTLGLDAKQRMWTLRTAIQSIQAVERTRHSHQ